MASVVGLGTFEIGGSSWWDPVDQKVAVDTIRLALDLGINFIDTAPVYGFGQSERIVGEAIKGHREKIIICTKVGEEFAGNNEGRFHYNHDGRSVYTCLTPKAIERQLEQSLRNLGTDYIDIYMPHFFFDLPEVGCIEDIMATMERLIDAGKIRSVGLSNSSPEHLRKFAELGESRISCVQLYTNVLDHSMVNPELLGQVIEHGISGVGINCLAKGLLSGAFPNDFRVRDGSERSESAWFYGDRIAAINKMIKGWEPLRNLHEAAPASLALAWVLAQRGVSHLLTGVTAPEHVLQAAKASEIILTIAELDRMTADATHLRQELIENQIQNVVDQIRGIAELGTPLAIWGAGVTLDYICRRLPLTNCNIVGVFDSNPLLNGQSRLGHSVRGLEEGLDFPPDTTLVVAIPKEPRELDPILHKLGLHFSSILHLGHLKALCK
jgi:methylglyoxal reductase